jgi:thymidylate synthase (FAD)
VKVSLVSITQPKVTVSKDLGWPSEDIELAPEELIVYIARVSNPDNQLNIETAPKLLRYCIKKGHWSIFEQVSMGVEIVTSRAISAQILRHRSFSFQEFSQRYAPVTKFEVYEARRGDDKNRQNSFNDLHDETKAWFRDRQLWTERILRLQYENALSLGIAKECARFLLPMSAQTTLYMSGTVRSWVHYLQVRLKPDVQKEHRDIAIEVEKIFKRRFPHTWEAAFGEKEIKENGCVR